MKTAKTRINSGLQAQKVPHKSEHSFYNALYFNHLQRLQVNTFCSPHRTKSVHFKNAQLLDFQLDEFGNVQFCAGLKRAKTRMNKGMQRFTTPVLVNTPNSTRKTVHINRQNGINQ